VPIASEAFQAWSFPDCRHQPRVGPRGTGGLPGGPGRAGSATQQCDWHVGDERRHSGSSTRQATNLSSQEAQPWYALDND